MSAKPTVAKDSQDWANVDGVTAWHLIERHADNWADISLMVDEFIAAKIAKATRPAPQGVAEVMQLVGGYAEKSYARETNEELARYHDDCEDAVTAVVQERDALRLDKVHHEKVIEDRSREAHQWWSALQVATARVAELDRMLMADDDLCTRQALRIAELEGDVARDAARYKWLRERWMTIEAMGDFGVHLKAHASAVPSGTPDALILDARIDAAIASAKERRHG